MSGNTNYRQAMYEDDTLLTSPIRDFSENARVFSADPS
jgi:hypothetical protein